MTRGSGILDAESLTNEQFTANLMLEAGFSSMNQILSNETYKALEDDLGEEWYGDILRISTNSVISAAMGALKNSLHQNICLYNLEANMSEATKQQLEAYQLANGNIPPSRKYVGKNQFEYTYVNGSDKKVVLLKNNEIVYDINVDANGNIAGGSMWIDGEMKQATSITVDTDGNILMEYAAPTTNKSILYDEYLRRVEEIYIEEGGLGGVEYRKVFDPETQEVINWYIGQEYLNIVGDNGLGGIWDELLIENGRVSILEFDKVLKNYGCYGKWYDMEYNEIVDPEVYFAEYGMEDVFYEFDGRTIYLGGAPNPEAVGQYLETTGVMGSLKNIYNNIQMAIDYYDRTDTISGSTTNFWVLNSNELNKDMASLAKGMGWDSLAHFIRPDMENMTSTYVNFYHEAYGDYALLYEGTEALGYLKFNFNWMKKELSNVLVAADIKNDIQWKLNVSYDDFILYKRSGGYDINRYFGYNKKYSDLITNESMTTSGRISFTFEEWKLTINTNKLNERRHFGLGFNYALEGRGTLVVLLKKYFGALINAWTR
jgi:hypothetical protein